MAAEIAEPGGTRGLSPDDPLLRVEHLTVRYTSQHREFSAVEDVSYDLRPGEILAVIGESGSGKSTAAEALLGLHRGLPGAETTGSVTIRGRDLTSMSEKELEGLRGREIAIIFQDPGSALNPAMTIGKHFAEIFKLKLGLRRAEARDRTVEILQSVGLRDASRRLNDLPYQLSGGMRQRAMIGLAIAMEPAILVADEPTTALDVTVQAEVLRVVKGLVTNRQMGVLFISHDLAVAGEIADRIGVMYGGKLVELGTAQSIMTSPRHPYTSALLRSTPALTSSRASFIPIKGSPPDPAARPSGCSFHPRCAYAFDVCPEVVPILREVTDDHSMACHLPGDPLPSTVSLTDAALKTWEARVIDRDEQPLLVAQHLVKSFPGPTADEPVKAVDDVSLELYPRETLGLVGESGCGKSTTSRMLAGLLRPTAGTVMLHGSDIWQLGRGDVRTLRRDIQMVFQDPWSSLNPRMSIGELIEEPWIVNKTGYTRSKRKEESARLLEDVGLRARDAGRRPNELSGGQRQRVAIARALALKPAVLICDEPLSALDVSVQAQILNLLRELQAAHQISYLFISHDLAVVRQLADRVVVMNAGQVVESGPVDQVYDSPREEYTRRLLAAIPGKSESS